MIFLSLSIFILVVIFAYATSHALASSTLEVVSKPLIAFKSKARADEKAEHIR
jgi:hypothetical protein